MSMGSSAVDARRLSSSFIPVTPPISRPRYFFVLVIAITCDLLFTVFYTLHLPHLRKHDPAFVVFTVLRACALGAMAIDSHVKRRALPYAALCLTSVLLALYKFNVLVQTNLALKMLDKQRYVAFLCAQLFFGVLHWLLFVGIVGIPRYTLASRQEQDDEEEIEPSRQSSQSPTRMPHASPSRHLTPSPNLLMEEGEGDEDYDAEQESSSHSSDDEANVDTEEATSSDPDDIIDIPISSSPVDILRSGSRRTLRSRASRWSIRHPSSPINASAISGTGRRTSSRSPNGANIPEHGGYGTFEFGGV